MLFFFFFNDTATTEIYTLSLHDALPIFGVGRLAHRRVGEHELAKSLVEVCGVGRHRRVAEAIGRRIRDRKSTRLNSSHSQISYAVFCLKKKKKESNNNTHIYRERRQSHR